MKKLLYSFLFLLTITSGFSQITSVALVGEAAGGWPSGIPGSIDTHQMSTTDGINWTLNTVILTTAAANPNGGLKFRANNAWTTNWGSLGFPNGTGVLNGANIPCTAGSYGVTFNSTTGVYTFTPAGIIHTVKLVGAAVPTTGEVSLSTTDLANFTVSNITLINGNAQFSIDGVLSGNVNFPSGVLLNNSTQIPVNAGTYSTISLNINSGAYTFTLSPIPTIAIVGGAAGGWPGDPGNPGPIDINQMSTADGVNYTLNTVSLTLGDIKFRANNNWTTSWGGLSFPTGPQSGSGTSNITVTAPGHYRAVLNRNTGVYTFDFPTVSIVGEAVGGWPGDAGNPGPTDVHQLATTDGETYTVNNLVITSATVGGGAKFRQDSQWTTSWGNTSFPSATTSNGSNITTVAGTYDVIFTRSTGAYNFTPSLANVNFTKSSVSIYPNPTQNQWNFVSNDEIINCVTLYDMLGKKVTSLKPNSLNISIDATNLNQGIYLAKVETISSNQTIKLVKQ